jgi:hypothetical protein
MLNRFVLQFPDELCNLFFYSFLKIPPDILPTHLMWHPKFFYQHSKQCLTQSPITGCLRWVSSPTGRQSSPWVPHYGSHHVHQSWPGGARHPLSPFIESALFVFLRIPPSSSCRISPPPPHPATPIHPAHGSPHPSPLTRGPTAPCSPRPRPRPGCCCCSCSPTQTLGFAARRAPATEEEKRIKLKSWMHRNRWRHLPQRSRKM